MVVSRFREGLAVPFVGITFRDVKGGTIYGAADGQVTDHRAVAAIVGIEILGVVARGIVGLSVPNEGAANDGVELNVLAQTHGEVQGDDAVAAACRVVSAFIVARGGVGLSVPSVAATTFEVAEAVGDLVGHGERQGDDAVAALGGLQVLYFLESAWTVVLKAETVVVIDGG